MSAFIHSLIPHACAGSEDTEMKCAVGPAFRPCVEEVDPEQRCVMLKC